MTQKCVKHIAKTSNSKANNGSFIRKQLVEVRRLLDELTHMEKKSHPKKWSNQRWTDYNIKLGRVLRILDELTKLQEANNGVDND